MLILRQHTPSPKLAQGAIKIMSDTLEGGGPGGLNKVIFFACKLKLLLLMISEVRSQV